ncbi:MAG TPA: hypothetical protein VFY90_14080 [Tepidiformaceae bacterium]|nr:hypothetical protein [Tepidiformaceae bacterium]
MTTTKPRKPIRFLGTKVATVVLTGALFATMLGAIAATGRSGESAAPDAGQRDVTYVTPNGSSQPSNGSAVSSQGTSPSAPKQQPATKVRKTRGS